MAQIVSHPDKVIVFDGECNLCNAWVDFILRRDTAMVFRFASRQSDPARKLLEKFGTQPDGLNSIALVSGHNLYIRSEAVLRILAELPRPWKALSLFLFVPRLVRDPVYAVVAQTRYHMFGRRKICRPADPTRLGRFLQ